MEYITKLFGSGLRFRSHIWLEGQRLNEHGFKLGAEYTQVWLQDRVICVIGKLDAFVTPTGEQAKLFHRKVNKQGDNPAVRIEGKRVQKLFGEKYTNVKATFSQGRIVIEGHEPVYARSVPKGTQGLSHEGNHPEFSDPHYDPGTAEDDRKVMA